MSCRGASRIINLPHNRFIHIGLLLLTLLPVSICNAQILEKCADTELNQTIQKDELTLLSLNISHGRKTAWNQMLVSTNRTYENLDLIAALLNESNADVIALQEVDGISRWSGRFNHVEYLIDSSQYQCAVHGLHADTWFFSFGAALLAQAQMKDSQSVSFPATPPTTSKGFVMTSLMWEVAGRQISVTAVSVHLDFSRRSVREEQAGILIDTLEKIDTPVILMGDFNSRWEQNNSQVKRIAEALELQAFEPESEVLGSYKKSSGKRLDWILISSELEFTRYEVLPDLVSDHLAIIAELTLSEAAGL